MKNIKILTIMAVGIIILSIAVVSINFKVDNIIEEKEEETSLFVKILADFSSGTAPISVNFKPLVLYEQGSPEYTWKFGDGTISNEKSPTHVYEKDGVYSCKLTVKDDKVEKTDKFNITVLLNNPPDVKIIVDKTTAFKKLGTAEINFDAQVFDPEGDDLKYNWTITHPQFFGIEKVETFNEKNFSIKFWRTGNYVAQLTVADEAGNSRTQYVRIQIQSSRIISAFMSATFFYTQFTTIVGIIQKIIEILGNENNSEI